jgi:hypothetical protein
MKRLLSVLGLVACALALACDNKDRSKLLYAVPCERIECADFYTGRTATVCADDPGVCKVRGECAFNCPADRCDK